MSLLTKRSCEGCGSEKAIPRTSNHQTTPPPGWFSLMASWNDGAGILRQRRLFVCSPMCGARALDLLGAFV